MMRENDKVIIGKLIEEMLNKPISSYEFEMIYKWFDSYPIDYIKSCIKLAKNHFAKSINYVDKVLRSNFEMYGYIVEELKSSDNIKSEVKVENNKPNSDINRKKVTQEELNALNSEIEELMKNGKH